MQDRKSRLALNSVFSLLSWLAPIGLGLAVTPIIIKYLGTELYGVYLVLLGFFSYSLTFNFGRPVAKYVAEFKAAGDDVRISETVSSAFWLNLGAGLLAAIVIVAASEWIVSDVLQVSDEFRDASRLVLIFGAVSIPVSQVGQVFQNALQGIHRFGKVSLLLNLNWLLLNAGNVVLVVSGYSIAALFAWNLLIVFVIGIVSFVVARSHDRNFMPGMRTGPMLRLVAGYGLNIFLDRLFGTALLLFERGWLIKNFGATESAFYLLPMMLATYLHGLIGSVLHAVFPVVNELLNDRDRLVILYKKATKLMLASAVLVVASVTILGKLFLGLWLGAEFAENGYPNLVIHFLTYGLIASMIVIWHMNEAHGGARLNSVQVFIWAAVAIPLMVVTSNIWLAEGMAASRLVGALVTVPMVFYSERKFLGAIQWQFWGALLLRIGLATVCVVVIERVILVVLEPSWITFLLAGSAGSLTYASVLYVTGFVTSDEKEMLADLARRVFPRSNDRNKESDTNDRTR